MNETLCRALIQARLTEEDVAARLQVDPKTVRRWLEGRVPYLRHRWAIAAMVGADETDLWPQLRTTRTRPDEIIAIYPHRRTVPRDVWLRLFGSAQCEIGILEEADLPVAADQAIVDALAERARAGVRLRICLYDRNAPAGAQGVGCGGLLESSVQVAVVIYAPLRERGEVEIRLHHGAMYNSIYLADDQLMVMQAAYGTSPGEVPVLHLRQVEGGDMAGAYQHAFERAWAEAHPIEVNNHY